MRVVEVGVEPLWEEAPTANCWEYEVWDTSDRLVYVGVADDFGRRWRQHEDKSWWLNEIELKHIIVNGYRSRHEARQEEAHVINEHAPIYNTNRESRYYRYYLDLFEKPDRPTDEWDCIRVDHRLFLAVKP